MIGIIVIFVIIAIMMGCLVGALVDMASYDTDSGVVAGFISGIVLTIITIVIIIQVLNVELEKSIAYFEETKATYNASLEDENLTGFERVEITNTAIEANRDLAKLKIDLKQWWNAPYKNKIVKELNELTPIGKEK